MPEISKRALMKTLERLVSIRSDQNCLEISSWIKSHIEGNGFSAWSDRDGNLVTEIGKGRGFLLNAHMDTVPAGEWPGAFRPVVKGGRLYGRGASDCKAGAAAMLEILKRLDEKSLGDRIVFSFSVNEEGGPLERNGAYRSLKRIKATHGLVLESSFGEGRNETEIVFGCNGRAEFELDIKGRPGHAGRPHTADNPITKAAEFIRALNKESLPEENIPGAGRMRSTSSVTQINAMEGSNVIPGRCRLTVDYRLLPHEKPADTRKRLESIGRKTAGDFELKEIKMIEGCCVQDREFLSVCESAVYRAGMKPVKKFALTRGDMSVFYNRGGIKTLQLGPGTTGQAHRVPEYCNLDGLERVTGVVSDIVMKWRSGD